jgi:aspartyl-tRNA(Asn)/glutamyl-tRNA(Gln) amidotransferase subunit B
MAREGGIKEGRFPRSSWLSPCYLRALVETGEDIEALRLLGKPEEGEPGFYDLLRGRALHAAGDRTGARATFQRYLNVWPGDLETRSEIKNLNSFNFIEKALHYEISRQIDLKERGEEVVQETRLYDPERDETRSMRGKEAEHDYRYFPEPDLTPVTFTREQLEDIRSGLPELPVARLQRYTSELGLEDYPADLLVRDHEAAIFFDACIELYPKVRSVANWILNALKEEANSRKGGIASLGLEPGRFVDLVKAVDAGVVSSQKGRDVLKPMLESDKPVLEIISELGLEQISDDSALREQVEKVLAEHPGPVEDVRAGKKNSVNFLVGQVMKETRGKANPGKVAEMIGEILSA